MSVEINKSNYEAFYLDYLEGNLHGEALAAFEAFMADNPDLLLDDTEMVHLVAPEETMDQLEKLAMKRTVDIAELSVETVDYFLIARTEGLLSAQEEAQLENWLAANAFYRNDAKLYALTQLQADQQQVFTGKEDLKRKQGGRVIPLWFTGAAVAAGLALLITIAIPNGTENQPTGQQVAAQHPTDSTGKQNGTSPEGNNTTNPVQQQQQNGNSTNGAEHTTPHKQQVVTPSQPMPMIHQQDNRRQETANIAPLNKHMLPSLENNPGELAKWEAPVITPKQTPEAPVNHDVALQPVEMKNPIEPVTKGLASTLNTPVDFRTAKATKKKPGGFYLRIGKLEVSHRSASL